MKKTLFAFMALATAFGATSCQSDEELTQPTGKPMVINAVAEGIGTKTRATMAYKYDILWGETEQIIVKGDSKSATFDLTAGAGTTEGTFACQTSTFASGDAVEAYYPATLVKDGSLEWPAEQTSSTVIPMYSKQTLGGTDEENFSFASLGAMLQIVFNTKQENVTLKSITLKDDTNPLSGTFTVDEDGMAEMEANTDAPGITLDLGTGKALGKGANFFHIAVPAGKYSNLSITFTATDNSTCTFVNGSATLTHNTVGRLVLTGTEFKSDPTGEAEVNTSAGITDNKVKWVQLWKNGPKFAEYNVGATSVAEYGGYYAWGGSQNKVDDHNTTNTGTGNLTGTDDTATKLWGSNWRMPTSAELQGLLDNCDVAWTTVGGVSGRKFTGQGAYSSNSIFLPAAGNGGYEEQDSYGYYWSSTPYGSECAYSLLFLSDGQNVTFYGRYHGYSVRAVLNEAPATKGTAKATIAGGDFDVNWVQLWENGPKFAEYNIGATSATDYGGYYEWGGSTNKNKGINYNEGTVELTGDNDTATKLWGSNWRMPTKAELQALINSSNVNMQWTGSGYKFTGKGDYSSNSIFLPAAGYYEDEAGDVFVQGSNGYYWSSTPNADDSDCAYYLGFKSNDLDVYDDRRGSGYSVRAVLKESAE